MRLTHLHLANFRNYTLLDLQLPAGPILLYGDNAQGKTTLLEAVYYLATSRSPNASSDRQLLNWYALEEGEPLSVGRLTAEVQPAGDARPRRLEIRLIHDQGNSANGSFRREVLVNGVKVRMMDLLGNLNVVLFLPQDVTLVSAAPAERRRYMDITLCQVDRQYCRSLSQYNRVISQRNALLRALQERSTRSEELAPWDLKLVDLGALVMHRRASLVAELERTAGKIHFEQLTGGSESLRLLYRPRLHPNSSGCTGDSGEWVLTHTEAEIASELRDSLQAARGLEIQRGLTLIGPHRDEMRFQVNGRDLGDYGSRGQQRTAVLALKLAEVGWMESKTGDRPVLLLDEVLAELDHARRSFLLERIGSAEQAILTATDPSMYTDTFLSRATLINVVGGQISPHRKDDGMQA